MLVSEVFIATIEIFLALSSRIPSQLVFMAESVKLCDEMLTLKSAARPFLRVWMVPLSKPRVYSLVALFREMKGLLGLCSTNS